MHDEAFCGTPFLLGFVDNANLESRAVRVLGKLGRRHRAKKIRAYRLLGFRDFVRTICVSQTVQVTARGGCKIRACGHLTQSHFVNRRNHICKKLPAELQPIRCTTRHFVGRRSCSDLSTTQISKVEQSVCSESWVVAIEQKKSEHIDCSDFEILFVPFACHKRYKSPQEGVAKSEHAAT